MPIGKGLRWAKEFSLNIFFWPSSHINDRMREVVKHECSDSNLSLIRKILPESDCLYSTYQRPGQVEGQETYFSFDGGA